MHHLSPEQLTAYAQWKYAKRISNVCSACHNNEYYIREDAVTMIAYGAHERIPFISESCSTCGHTRMFAAAKIFGAGAFVKTHVNAHSHNHVAA